MMTMLRRLFWLALLGGAGYAGWTVWQRQDGTEASAAPEWPPIGDTGSASPKAPEKAPAAWPKPDHETIAAFADVPTDDPQPAADGEALWVAPLDDGSCPDGYPIKANDNSGIYHVPGGQFYDRTVPERCYARADQCEADGYRAAKS